VADFCKLPKVRISKELLGVLARGNYDVWLESLKVTNREVE